MDWSVIEEAPDALLSSLETAESATEGEMDGEVPVSDQESEHDLVASLAAMTPEAQRSSTEPLLLSFASQQRGLRIFTVTDYESRA